MMSKHPVFTLVSKARPLAIDTYDTFAFETRTRELISQMMAPIFELTNNDHTASEQHSK
jgi:hypothetical protein